MEANRLERPALVGLSLVVLWLGTAASAAEHRSTNFVVSAPTAEIARQVAETAENSRRELALAWLGRTLPDWYRPCPIRVTVGQMGAGGATTFTFDRGEVAGWNMRVQGSLERILDSVIPHEVSHTVFASHFRRPLPRWADEGAATLIEHVEERKRQEVLLNRVIRTSQRIPLERLLSISEYPSDMQQVYTLYAEGYSLANYLVQQRGEQGRAVFLQFIDDAHRQGWPQAIRKHYRFESVAALEKSWTDWVVAGSPPVRRDEDPRLAVNERTPESQAGASTVEGAQIPAAGVGGPREVALALASLPPLPPPNRPLRQSREEDSRLSAPAPDSIGRGEGRPQPASAVALAEASQRRVVPRRERAPLFHAPLSVVTQQWMQRGGGAAPARSIASARVIEPTGEATYRGQSPEGRHWSEFSRFPQLREQEPPGAESPAGG